MIKIIVGYLLLCLLLCDQPFIQSLSLIAPEKETIVIQNHVQTLFDDTIYNDKWCCQTELKIIQFSRNSSTHLIEMSYNGTTLNQDNIMIWVEKEGTPLPSIVNTTGSDISLITLDSNCPLEITRQNYWSKVNIQIFNSTRFSFRLDCDNGARHKNFQWGYVVIMVINSCIMVGVALYSRIWSIQLSNNRALGIPLLWHWLLLFTIIVIGLGILLLYLGQRYNNLDIFGTTAYVAGSIVAFIFGVIVLNEIFFLFQKLRQRVWKILRICDILSFSISVLVVVLIATIPPVKQNLLSNLILNIVITVGAIKLFKFLNLKTAFICCFIIFAEENIAALIIHFVYNDVSYNDVLGSRVITPLFMQIPTLTSSLYQKCSWLPVSEIVLPGITIAYLRRYDFSRDSKLYLIIGNLLFVISTFIWIIVQSLTQHSVPFSLITYPSLFIPIIILAKRREELKILITGRFHDPEFLHYSEPRSKALTASMKDDDFYLNESAMDGLILKPEDLQASKRQDI